MDIGQALNTAIEYEIRVRDLYAEALAEAGDPVAKKLFKLMADEEDNHVSYLEAKVAEWERRKRLGAEGPDTAVPPRERIERAAQDLRKVAGRPAASPRELDLLKRAWQIENETSRFYQKMVDELPEQGRAFFGRFLEIEQGHIALVQAEIDALSGPGFWFDMPEFELR